LRYFLEIRYRGTLYHGWQIQQNALSVQEVIEEALHKVIPGNSGLSGSGRTDTGVHALQQFAHFDTDQKLNTLQLQHQLNAMLPHDIAVQAIIPVKGDAHARFDARIRAYQYHIHQQKDPFLLDQSYFFKPALHLENMNEAASLLADGKDRDYACFSKAGGGQESTLCRVYTACWQQTDQHRLVFHISANRFLRNMVRAIVGTLIEVGTGKISRERFVQILQSNNRQQAGRSVPAEGLYLSRVEYPRDIFLHN
jgi:tRNA pseudouridine38-40 synthase